jgi:hypothetical protein
LNHAFSPTNLNINFLWLLTLAKCEKEIFAHLIHILERFFFQLFIGFEFR